MQFYDNGATPSQYSRYPGMHRESGRPPAGFGGSIGAAPLTSGPDVLRSRNMSALRTEKQNVFGGLITSKTRIRILMRLFLNPGNRAYLRELVSEFGSSPSQVREELQQLSAAGLLTNEREGRQVYYRANDQHSLFPELNSMVRKALGMDHILESIVRRLGELERAILIDDYAEGKDTGIIDLVLVGSIDQANLSDLVNKTERYIGRKIRILSFTAEEYDAMKPTLVQRPSFELWSRGAEQRTKQTRR